MKDTDIRQSIKKQLFQRFNVDKNTRIIDELGILEGSNRVDIAVVNSYLHGYEIKSELDNLSRLPNQIASYTKIFDYISIVASEKHIEGIINQVPSYCGIFKAITSNNQIKLVRIRRPYINKNSESIAIAKLLWREELLNILSDLGIKKGLQSKPKSYLLHLLCNTLTKQELSSTVRETIKSRNTWRVDSP